MKKSIPGNVKVERISRNHIMEKPDPAEKDNIIFYAA